MIRALLFASVVAGHSWTPVWQQSWSYDEMQRNLWQIEEANGWTARHERVPHMIALACKADTLWATDGRTMYWASTMRNPSPGGYFPRDARNVIAWHSVGCVLAIP